MAREHAIAFAQYTAFFNSLDDLTDRVGAHKRPAPGAIAGVIGKLHGVHRPDLDADALQWKHSGRVAGMAIGYMGLDRENVHAGARYSTNRASPIRIRPWFQPNL